MSIYSILFFNTFFFLSIHPIPFPTKRLFRQFTRSHDSLSLYIYIYTPAVDVVVGEIYKPNNAFQQIRSRYALLLFLGGLPSSVSPSSLFVYIEEIVGGGWDEGGLFSERETRWCGREFVAYDYIVDAWREIDTTTLGHNCIDFRVVKQKEKKRERDRERE